MLINITFKYVLF